MMSAQSHLIRVRRGHQACAEEDVDGPGVGGGAGNGEANEDMAAW